MCESLSYIKIRTHEARQMLFNSEIQLAANTEKLILFQLLRAYCCSAVLTSPSLSLYRLSSMVLPSQADFLFEYGTADELLGGFIAAAVSWRSVS